MAQLRAAVCTVAIGMGMVAQGATILGPGDTLNGSPVNSFVDVNASNQVTAVGFQVSGAAVRNPGAASAVFLTLPSQAAPTNFTELGLDWNPQGHPPPGIYTVPHFDFHFYYIPDAVRAAIPGGVVYDPGAQFRPAGYSAPGPSVPAMGSHALDLTSPEFNGGSFTQTFIYGFDNNQEGFVEPMATQAYLEGLTGTNSFTIRQPKYYALPTLPTLVPTTVQYNYDAATDMYTVSLGDFTTANAAPEPGTLTLVGIAAAGLIAMRRRSARA